MIICAVGVFIDISVITVAPIALAIGKKSGYHKEALLLAMIGGGKAGNIISPNPNTIVVSDAEGLTAYRFGSTHDMIIVINNRKHNIYLLTNG